MAGISTITPCLWFNGQARDAAEFYISIFPDSRIDHVMKASMDWPGGKAGDELFVEFTLNGQSMQALNGGSDEQYTNAISLSVKCKDQQEVDLYWEKLTANGGREIMCGWLNDKYGVPWQIVPERLLEMQRDADTERVHRVTTAMYEMVKLDLAALERAYRGE